MLRRSKKQGQGQPLRRQRQQTGAVFSYYQNRVIPEQDSLGSKTRPKRAKSHHLTTILGTLLLVFCLGYVLSINSQAKVVIVDGQDKAAPSELRNRETYEAAAQEMLKSSPLNYTKLTLNTNAFAEALTQRFPELANATVTLPLINRRPVIYLEPAHPAFILANKNGLYVVDEQGRALTKVDEQGSQAPARLPVITDETGQEVVLKTVVIPARQVQFMQEVQAQLNARQITVTAFTLPATPNQLLVKLQGLPYYLKLTFSGDARQQSGAYLALKQHLDEHNVVPAEYVDVRVDERVYYK